MDEDPDQHSHPLFRQSPGRKMQGARGREGIKRNRIRNERFPGSGDRTQKKPTVEPTQGKETDGRRQTRQPGPRPRHQDRSREPPRRAGPGKTRPAPPPQNPVEGSEAPRNHSPEAGATQERAQAQRHSSIPG